MVNLRFVGREDILDLIKQKADSLFANQQNQLLFINGLQGMGKTRLLKEVNSQFDKDQHFINAYIDMREFKNTQVEEALKKMSLKLKKQNDIPFILFSFAYFVYLRKMHPSYDPSTFQNSISEKNGTFRNIVSLCSKMPIVGEAFKLGDFVLDIVDLIGTSYISYSKELAKSIETDLRNLDTLDALDVAELLPKYFASDLNKFMNENGVRSVFFLDVYESILEKDVTREAISDQEKWLFDSKSGLFHCLNNSLFILSGRDEIFWMKNGSNLKDVYLSKKLDQLEPEDIKVLLETIPEVEIRDRLETITKGHPFSIDLAIDLYNQKENFSSEEKVSYFSKIDSSKLLQDYFIENMIDREKTLLTLLSLCNFWNKEIFVFLNDTFKLGYSTLDYPKIINHSYVETSDNENFTLHSLMTESLQKRCDQKTAESLHQAMLGFYQKKLVGIEDRFIDGNDDKALIEACYHGYFATDNKTNKQSFFEWLITVTSLFSNAGKWLLLIDVYKQFIMPEVEKTLSDPLKALFFGRLATNYHQTREFTYALTYYEKALSIIESLTKTEPKLFLPDLATTKDNIGQIFAILHEWEKSLSYFAQALEIRRALAETNNQNNLTSVILTLNNIGNLYADLQQRDKAMENFNEALDICRSLSKANIGPQSPLASTLNNTGLFLVSLHEWEKAREYYEEALEVLRVKAEINPQMYIADLVMTENNFANLLVDLKEWDKAKSYFLEILNIYRNLSKTNPQTYLFSLAMTLNNFAVLLFNLHEWDKAREYYEEALEIRRDLAKTNPQIYLPDVALNLNNLGALLSDLHEWDKAIEYHKEALLIFRNLSKHNKKNQLKNMVALLNNLGIIYTELHEWDKAKEYYEEALEIRRDLAKTNPQIYLPDVANSLNNLGLHLAKLHNWDKAKEYYEEALSIYKIINTSNHHVYLPDIAVVLTNFGTLQAEMKNIDKAKEYYEEALGIYRTLFEFNSKTYAPNLATALSNLGLILVDFHDLVTVGRFYKEALEIRKKLAEEFPAIYFPDLASSLNNLGILQIELHNDEEAVIYFEESIEIYKRLAKNYPKIYLPDIAGILTNLGIVKDKLSKIIEANTIFQEALTIFEQINQQEQGIYNDRIYSLKVKLASR